MKKHKQRNHVAQHAWNRSGQGAHKDKTKYCRKDKHKGSDKGLYFWPKFLFR